jgi:hypothetical protein
MALRRGPYYRGGSLQYPELPEAREHLQSLKSAGWVTDDPIVDFQALIDALPSTWLVEGFGLRSRPNLSKERMKWQAREIYPEPLLWMSVDSVNLIFKRVLNRIHEADVAEIPVLRLNYRIRFRTPLSEKAVRKRRYGDMVAFRQIGTSDDGKSL